METTLRLCFRAELSSQETATAALLKWGYFTDNQRFVKAPVSGQMKGLTPQGRNCRLFFFAALFRIPTSILLHLLPPLSLSLALSLLLSLSDCARTPCRHFVSHYSLNSFLVECQMHVFSFSPSRLLPCTLYCSLCLILS